MAEKAVITDLTPSAAQRLLRNNEKNRPLNKSRIQRLAKAIREGRWIFNGASIVVDTKHRLLDGQHRLHAVIQADKKIKTVLVTNVSQKAFDTIDQGAKRSGSDIFAICGVTNPGQVSAALTVIWQSRNKIVEGTAGASYTPDMDERVSLFDSLPDFERFVHECSKYRKALVDVAPFSKVVGMIYLFREKDLRAAEVFIGLLSSGKGGSDCPPVVLHRLLSELRKSDYSLGAQAQCAYLKIAWNHFAAGQAVNDLELPETLAIPINDVTSCFWLSHE